MFYIFIFGASFAYSEDNPHNYPWLAFGDIRGNIEPCGCDPKTDLGGIQRLAQFVAKERAANDKVVLLSLGNSQSDASGKERLDGIMNKALATIAPDVTLLNRLEIRRSDKNYSTYDKSQNFVLSNLKPRAKVTREYRSVLHVKGLSVVGIVEPTSATDRKYLEPLTPSLVAKIKKLRGKSKRLLVLYSGPVEKIALIEALAPNEIILSNLQPFGSDFDHSEKEGRKPLEYAVAGKSYRSVPLGGIGVLRGGGAQFAKAKKLEQILNPRQCQDLWGNNTSSNCKSVSPPSRIGGSDVEMVTWLSRDYQNDSKLKKIFSEYRSGARAMFLNLAQKRAKDLNSSHYDGNDACATCHAASYKVWKATSHSTAYNTLVDLKQHENTDCVGCHVVGYDQKGGFASLKDSPHLAHVGCESCHGPRKEHVSNPTKYSVPKWWKKDAKTVCLECHKGAHSPDYNYEDYWPRIAHGK